MENNKTKLPCMGPMTTGTKNEIIMQIYLFAAILLDYICI